jgi:hypothetical protein
MTPFATTDSQTSTGLIARKVGGSVAQTSLALLRELESSLIASQKALLGGNIAGLEQGTVEQRRLRDALEIFWAQAAMHPPQNDVPEPEGHCNPELATQLRSIEVRVLHLVRVQVALLARAQRSLRILSNLLAGSAEGYGPAGNAGTAESPARTRDAQERNACRA